MKQNIRVLYVVSDLLEGMGGIQSFVMSVYDNIDRSNIQIDFVIHVDKEPSYCSYVRSLGGKIYKAPQLKRDGIVKYICWWNKFFKEHSEYKIVHGHMKAYISLYLFIAKMHKRITIAHSHVAFPKLPFIKKHIEKIILFPLRWIADYHFACSVDAGKSLFGKRIITKSSFLFIPNARDTKKFIYNENIRNSIRHKLGISKNFVIGNVGRFHKNKNHLFLLKIFSEIYRKDNTARLLLLGDGPLKEQLTIQVKTLKIEQAVIFQGVVSNPEDYYQAMDVFVFTSIYEGLGMVLIEAQISGLPCVFSANLPKEIDLEVGLCHRVSLKQSTKVWSDEILKQKAIIRFSYNKEAADKDFEITKLAKKLEKFYINIGK